MGFLPKMIENKRGLGVLSNAPRFSAYVASKSALDSFAACAASEFVDKRINTTCRLLAQRMPLRDNARDDVARACKDPRPISERFTDSVAAPKTICRCCSRSRDFANTGRRR